jgi:hypothetical protein
VSWTVRLGRQRLAIVPLVGGLIALSLSLVTAPSTSAAPVTKGVSALGAHGSLNHPVTKSKHVERTYLNNGVTRVVDRRTVHVTVGDTQDLKSLQQIPVTWSGAHVTDGLELDENSDLAQNEEYSFDLFECRGIDSTSVPKKDRISPQTCWTQYGDERYFAQGAEAPWQSDLFAPAADRKSIVGAPPMAKQPALCKSLETRDVTQRWLPFDAANGKVYPGGNSGCAGLPPEASPANFSNLSLPSNETFGVTSPNGTGRAQFDVFTDEDHASLGCSTTVPCSLVAVPIEGISCDPDGANLPLRQQPTQAEAAAATTNCETKGVFTPGELLSGVPFGGQPAVDGSLWWSPSNWRNRISFPLTFAQADNICNVVNNKVSIAMYGSELMTQATTQWSPHFCLNRKLFNVSLVQTPEPEARRLVSSGSVVAAASSYGPSSPYPLPTVNAPIAVSGFGIAFDVDNAHHNPVARLNLDPRLLAKLLTESYPAQTFVKSEYPVVHGVSTLSNNPLTIADDPEFQALNPGIPPRISDAAATLLTVNVQSDVMTALTTYINDDPAARAWLNGAPDPWGMRVNPNYKGITLPVQSWPLLDSFEPLGEYKVGLNDCLAVDPVPYLPLVADPQASLYQIALDADFSIAQPQTTCVLPSPIPGDTAGAKLVANGRQAIGDRFMLSVVSLADAARFDLPLASLETHSTVSPGMKFTSPAGQTFVAPTEASMRAAVDTAKPDQASGTWPIDYQTLRESNNSGAYPGTMIMYVSVPTKGVPVATARDYANFLRYVAGPGQAQGSKPGQLAAGYLPLTAANGLSKLAGYTVRAAADVQSQNNKLPSLIDSGSSSTPTPTQSSGPPAPGGTATAPANGGPNPSLTSPPTTPPTTGPQGGKSPVVAPNVTPEALGMTDRISGGLGSWLLPSMLVVLVVAASAAAGIRIRTGGRRR